jgi:S-adenosylmethionine decarboxylase
MSKGPNIELVTPRATGGRNMFGPHLILEAYGSPKDRLADLNLVCQVLEAYPAKLNMTKIMPPYVFRYEGVIPEDWGISGVVLIAESHISIHSFPDKQFVTLDIFSCRDFVIEDAIEYFVDAFQPRRYDEQVLQRGREFPKSAGRAGRIIASERRRLATKR